MKPRLRRLIARTNDPFSATTALAVVLTIGGFLTIWLGYRGIARTLLVPLQVPFLISGAIAGIALLGFGLSLVAIQSSRRASAEMSRDLDRMIEACSELLSAARNLKQREAARRA